MKKQKVYEIIQSVVILVIGILMSLSILDSTFIDILIGIACLLLGVYLIVKSLFLSNDKSILLPSGIGGGVLIAYGIAVFAKYSQPINFLSQILIVAIIAVGALLIVQSILTLIKSRSKSSITLAILFLIFGVALLSFGICFICVNSFGSYVWMACGILLAVYGLYLFIRALVTLKK